MKKLLPLFFFSVFFILDSLDARDECPLLDPLFNFKPHHNNLCTFGALGCACDFVVAHRDKNGCALSYYSRCSARRKANQQDSEFPFDEFDLEDAIDDVLDEFYKTYDEYPIGNPPGFDSSSSETNPPTTLATTPSPTPPPTPASSVKSGGKKLEVLKPKFKETETAEEGTGEEETDEDYETFTDEEETTEEIPTEEGETSESPTETFEEDATEEPEIDTPNPPVPVGATSQVDGVEKGSGQVAPPPPSPSNGYITPTKAFGNINPTNEDPDKDKEAPPPPDRYNKPNEEGAIEGTKEEVPGDKVEPTIENPPLKKGCPNQPANVELPKQRPECTWMVLKDDNGCVTSFMCMNPDAENGGTDGATVTDEPDGSVPEEKEVTPTGTDELTDEDVTDTLTLETDFEDFETTESPDYSFKISERKKSIRRRPIKNLNVKPSTPISRTQRSRTTVTTSETTRTTPKTTTQKPSSTSFLSRRISKSRNKSIPTETKPVQNNIRSNQERVKTSLPRNSDSGSATKPKSPLPRNPNPAPPPTYEEYYNYNIYDDDYYDPDYTGLPPAFAPAPAPRKKENSESGERIENSDRKLKSVNGLSEVEEKFWNHKKNTKNRPSVWQELLVQSESSNQ